MKNIIFHHPLPLDEHAKSASGIRPFRMLAAFKSLGCDVDLVVGYSSERKRSIAKVKEKVGGGHKYDMVYAESSTMPTVLTDPHHLPLHPLMDLFFFKYCNSNNIPIGLFYRDIYWLFDEYGRGMNTIKAIGAKLAYKFDLWVYQRTLARLYLPSMEMGRYVPMIDPGIMQALPPGHTSPEASEQYLSDLDQSRLKLFYVGGMSSHYQLHKLFSVVRELPQVQLTVCTREKEWRAVQHEYGGLSPNIKVIHETGDAMESHLKSSDVAVLFVKPQEYREFASPVKLYEYIGHRKPILASERTLAGRFVNEHGIGWTIPYEKSAVKKLLKGLLSDPTKIHALRQNLQRVARIHSWTARAQQVIEELTQ